MARPASALRPYLAFLVLGVAPACATGDGMQEKLRDATSAYNRSLRWNDYDRAADYLPQTAQPAFLAHHDEIGDALVIVDYELTRLDLDKETGIAASRAEISWHTERRLIVETTAVDQLWQWHEGQFLLVDERRSGGAPLAIFAEPGEDPHPYLPGIEAYRKSYAIGEDDKTKRRRARDSRRRGESGIPASGPAMPPGPAAPLAVDPPPELAGAR
jgi:hypothetical protein